MKKLIVIMMAVMMATFGISFTANAHCDTCCDPLKIARGCESAATNADCLSGPFDFDDYSNAIVGAETEDVEDGYQYTDTYCALPAGKTPCVQKAWFEMCQCLVSEGGPWANLIAGNTVDVSMEILVNGVAGDNGVYWAEYIDTNLIAMETYVSSTAACADTTGLNSRFIGDWTFYDADDVVVTTLETGGNCAVAAANRAVKFVATPGQTADKHGYVITTTDVTNKLDTWIVDIPAMRADSAVTSRGDVISVRVCFTKGDEETGGVCGSCEGCCCVVEIGTLCCDAEADSCCVYHPYVVAEDPYGNWGTGLVVTNVGGLVAPADMEATLTLTDAVGVSVTATLDDFDGTVLMTPLDSLSWSGGPFTGGACWLKIDANFAVDSYVYMTGFGVFGAGTLAKPCVTYGSCVSD